MSGAMRGESSGGGGGGGGVEPAPEANNAQLDQPDLPEPTPAVDADPVGGTP